MDDKGKPVINREVSRDKCEIFNDAYLGNWDADFCTEQGSR